MCILYIKKKFFSQSIECHIKKKRQESEWGRRIEKGGGRMDGFKIGFD